VTVSLELSGPEASRPHIQRAEPEHPSLLDPQHQMDALFGVVNIPNVVWIDEEGTIVRPAEPGWPGGRQEMPASIFQEMPRVLRAKTAPPKPENGPKQAELLAGGQDRDGYADAIRDWVEKGADSGFALTPAQVVERSQPRPMSKSEGAAHFELANHLWQAGDKERAIHHFNRCIALQPENWTYKRQAWSLWGVEQVGDERGRFVQGPIEGREDDWPFESDFRSDVLQLQPGEYYPATL